MSRLLESFAADEGFQMDGSSFSEEEEDSNHSYSNKSPECKKYCLSCSSVSSKEMRLRGEIFILMSAFSVCSS